MRPESRAGFTFASVVALLTVVAAGSLAAAEKYQIHLSPMPFTDAMQPVMTGKGTATATLDGETLTIAGTFTGLASPATKANTPSATNDQMRISGMFEPACVSAVFTIAISPALQAPLSSAAITVQSIMLRDPRKKKRMSVMGRKG